jgi:hypothetical protein
VLHFLKNGFSDFITINRFYRTLGVATAAGAEANAEAPRSVINWYF